MDRYSSAGPEDLHQQCRRTRYCAARAVGNRETEQGDPVQPNNAAYRRERAALYLSNRDFDKAIEDYTELIRLQPEDAHAYYSRGKAYTERGELEKATADYTKAIALDQDFVEAYRGRVAVCEKRVDLDGAIADYLQLIRLLPKAEADALQPRLVEIYKDRAKARTGAGDRDKAIRTSVQ